MDTASELLPEKRFELPKVNLDYLPKDMTQSLLQNFQSFDFQNIPIPEISDISGGVQELEDGVQDFLDGTVGEFLKNRK